MIYTICGSAIVLGLLELANYRSFLSTKKELEQGSVNNDKPQSDNKFSSHWTQYFLEEEDILQVIFDTHYQNIDFNNVDIKDILLMIYEYTGDLREDVVDAVIKKLQGKGVKFINDNIQNKELLINDIKGMSMDEVVDSFHINGRTKLIPIYKPLFVCATLKMIYWYTHYQYRWSGYQITTTPEDIRFFYLEQNRNRPTIVIFPGIGIGPVLYKRLADKFTNSVLIVDVPNVNICHHYYTRDIFLNKIYRRTMNHLNKLEITDIVLLGQSFGTVNTTNFIQNNLRKSEGITIKKVFLADPICFFAGFARLYASIYRYLNTPQRSMINGFLIKMLLGDIGNQYMFYRQLRPYIGTFYFNENKIESPEMNEKYVALQRKTTVFAAQRDAYIKYANLWAHLNKFFPHINKQSYYGYHSYFLYDDDVHAKIVNSVENIDYEEILTE